jgi:hypothetical protein
MKTTTSLWGSVRSGRLSLLRAADAFPDLSLDDLQGLRFRETATPVGSRSDVQYLFPAHKTKRTDCHLLLPTLPQLHVQPIGHALVAGDARPTKQPRTRRPCQ